MNNSDLDHAAGTATSGSKPAAKIAARAAVPSSYSSSSSSSSRNRQQQQQIQLDGALKPYNNAEDDNFFQELEKDFGQPPQFPSPQGHPDSNHNRKGRRGDRNDNNNNNNNNDDRGRAPYTSTLEHKHKHSANMILSSYEQNHHHATPTTASMANSSSSPQSNQHRQPSKNYHNQEFPSSSSDHDNQNHRHHHQQGAAHHNHHHHNQSKPQPQQNIKTIPNDHSHSIPQQEQQQQNSKNAPLQNDHHNRKPNHQPQMYNHTSGIKASFSSHSNCSSLRSDSYYSGSNNNNNNNNNISNNTRQSPGTSRHSSFNYKPQPQHNDNNNNNNNDDNNNHHHQFMSSPSSSSSQHHHHHQHHYQHHRRDDDKDNNRHDNNTHTPPSLAFKHKGSDNLTTHHDPTVNKNDSTIPSAIFNPNEISDLTRSTSKPHQHLLESYAANTNNPNAFTSPELSVFTGDSSSGNKQSRHTPGSDNQTGRTGSKSSDRARTINKTTSSSSSRPRQHSDGFIPTQPTSFSSTQNRDNYDNKDNQNFENHCNDTTALHHHSHHQHYHQHHHTGLSSNSDSEQAGYNERTLRQKDLDKWAKRYDKNNNDNNNDVISGIGGGGGVNGRDGRDGTGGGGGVHQLDSHHSHWSPDPTNNYTSYSDNEKQLLEEMRRMKKEHETVLRTYEGRVNQLMAKMYELRNIASMLENSSTTKTWAPFGGILPAGKLALMNMMGDNEEDTTKKGAKGDGGGSHIPPPLPPRPLRGSRVYPNKPIIHPNVSMRSLPWDRIILDGAAPSNDVLWKDMVEPDTDKEELERLFCGTQEDVSPSMNLYEDVCQRRDRLHIQPVRFYEAEHSQRIHSELVNLKCNMSDVSKAFATLNPGELHIDSFAELLELITSHREIDKIIHHGKRKGSSQLDVPEYLVFELSKIDHFKERLEFLRFKNKLQINLFEIDQQLKELHIACDEIRSSLPLKRVLETVLAVGNYLNGGTDKGQADGYKIEILTSLKYLQDKTKRGNLLELVMKIYCQKHENDQDFGCPTHFRLPEPSNMRHAAQVSFEDIQRALKELKDELTFVMNKLDSLSSKRQQTTITISLRVTTENFFTSAVEVLAEEEKLLENTKIHFTKTTAFFSHGEHHPTSPKEFFQATSFNYIQIPQLWASFLHDCKYYWKQAHRNLARSKFTDDLAMKNQMSSSSLPGFNNLKSVMMKHVVSFQQQRQQPPPPPEEMEVEMEESKAQHLQHISSWIESIGQYAMEMEIQQPEDGEGGGQGERGREPPRIIDAGEFGFPNVNDDNNNANEYPISFRQPHQQHHQSSSTHNHRHGDNQHKSKSKPIKRPQSPSYVNSAMYNHHHHQYQPQQSKSQQQQQQRQHHKIPNQPDIIPPSDTLTHPHHPHHHHHQTPSSPKPLSAIPPNVHKPQPISHTTSPSSFSSPSSSSPYIPTQISNSHTNPTSTDKHKFSTNAINNNKDDNSSNSDDNFGFSSPPPPIRPPPLPPQLNLHPDLTPEMLIPDKSMDQQAPTSPSATISKKNQNFFKAFLKKDTKKSSHSHHHAENRTMSPTGQNSLPTGSSTTSKSTVTPLNKLKNTFVQKISGAGSSKKSNHVDKCDDLYSDINTVSRAAQNFSPTDSSTYAPENSTKRAQHQPESFSPFQAEGIQKDEGEKNEDEYESPQFGSHKTIKNELEKLKRMKKDVPGISSSSSGFGIGGPDYQNYPNDQQPETEKGTNDDNNDGTGDQRDDSSHAMNTISRYQDQVSYMYGFRQVGTNNTTIGNSDLRKSSDQLNEIPADSNSHHYHHNGDRSKFKGEVASLSSNKNNNDKSGPPRLRAPIALGSNISISDVFGNSVGEELDSSNNNNSNSQLQRQHHDNRQQLPSLHVAPQIRTPKNKIAAAAVPISSSSENPKLVRAEAVPVYKAKLIPNYENQTKLDPRVDCGGIRGQAEPVRVPPAATNSDRKSSSKESYKMQLQKQSERYVSGGIPHSGMIAVGNSYTNSSSERGTQHVNTSNGVDVADAHTASSSSSFVPPLSAPTTYTVMPPKPTATSLHYNMTPFQVPHMKQQQQQQHHQMISPSHSSPHLYQQQQSQQHVPQSSDIDYHSNDRDPNHNNNNIENSKSSIVPSSSLSNQPTNHHYPQTQQKSTSTNKHHRDYENTRTDTRATADSTTARTPGRRSTSAHNLLSGNLKETREDHHHPSDTSSLQGQGHHVSRRDCANNEVKIISTARRSLSQGRLLKPQSETVTSLIDKFEKKQPSQQATTADDFLNLLEVSEKPPSMTSTPVTRRKTIHNIGTSSDSHNHKMSPYDINYGGNLSATSNTNSDAESQNQRSKPQSSLHLKEEQGPTPSQLTIPPFNVQKSSDNFPVSTQTSSASRPTPLQFEVDEDLNLNLDSRNVNTNIAHTQTDHHQPEFEKVISGSSQIMQMQQQYISSSSPSSSSSSRPKASSSSLDRATRQHHQTKPISSTPQNIHHYHHRRESPLSRRDRDHDRDVLPSGLQQSLTPSSFSYSSPARTTPSDRTRSDLALDQGGRSSSSQRSIYSSGADNAHQRHKNNQGPTSSSSHFQSPYLPKPEPQYPPPPALSSSSPPPPAQQTHSSCSPFSTRDQHHPRHPHHQTPTSTPNQSLISPFVSTSQQHLNLNPSPKKSSLNLIHTNHKSQNNKHQQQQKQTQSQDAMQSGYNSWPSSSTASNSHQHQHLHQQEHTNNDGTSTTNDYPQELRRAHQSSNNTTTTHTTSSSSSAFERPVRHSPHNPGGGADNNNDEGATASSADIVGSGSNSRQHRGNTAIVKPTVMHL